MTAPAAPLAPALRPTPGARADVARGRVESFSVACPELRNGERRVHVYLPRGYDASDARYPVLYLQDGQHLFGRGGADCWRIDETLDRAAGTEASARHVIVVGIESSDARWDEYGPWANDAMHAWVDADWSPRAVQGGDGDAYVAFVADRLKPLVDARYRTVADRRHTGIGGSSMGGLIALYAALRRSDVFGRVMAMSTAVWFAEQGGAWLSENRLVAAVRDGAVATDARFYVDVGTNERSRAGEPDVRDRAGRAVAYPQVYVDGSASLVDALRARGVGSAQLRFVVDAGGTHDEAAWARRFPSALQWLYAA